MGIMDKSFSLFNKAVGAAEGFAASHVFPTMRTDYMALKAGYTGMARAFANEMPAGLSGRVGFVGGAFARGGKAMMGAYRGMGISGRRAAMRMGAYAGGAGLGMWGISRLGRKDNQNPYGY